MKKNILILLMSLVCFMHAQAQEWCGEDFCYFDDSCCETNFYARILGGANFLQNTSIEGNKSTYQAGYIIAGSLGYCWRNGLSLEAEYAYRRNAIKKIQLYGQGCFKNGHFQTSSYMANLLWELPLSSWGGCLLGYLASLTFDFIEKARFGCYQARKMNLLVHAGHQTVRHYEHLSYTDWKATLNQEFDWFNVFVTYIGTNARHAYFDVQFLFEK